MTLQDNHNLEPGWTKIRAGEAWVRTLLTSSFSAPSASTGYFPTSEYRCAPLSRRYVAEVI